MTALIYEHIKLVLLTEFSIQSMWYIIKRIFILFRYICSNRAEGLFYEYIYKYIIYTHIYFANRPTPRRRGTPSTGFQILRVVFKLFNSLLPTSVKKYVRLNNISYNCRTNKVSICMEKKKIPTDRNTKHSCKYPV